MAWHARQAKKLEQGIDFRAGLLTLRRYLRTQPHIELNEACWTKFLQVKKLGGRSLWYFRTLSKNCMPWSSRENDLIFLSMLSPAIFPSAEERKRRSMFGKAVEPRVIPTKLVQKRTALYHPNKGKRPEPSGISVGLDGRPFTKKKSEGRLHITDSIEGPGGGSGAAFLLQWIISRENLLIDVEENWRFLHDAVLSWQLSPLQYWKKLSDEFDHSACAVVMACTYHLLEDGYKKSFVQQIGTRLDSGDGYGMGLIFKLKTKHQLWKPEDWVTRNEKQHQNYNYGNGATGGLKMAIDSSWLREVRGNKGRYKQTLDALPEYAAICLLTDALQFCHVWNCVNSWYFLPRLPLDIREASTRKLAEKDWALWDLNSFVFGGEDADMDGAVRIFLNHVLPEYADLWHHAAPLGMTLTEGMEYLDMSRIPVASEEVAIPQDFSF